MVASDSRPKPFGLTEVNWDKLDKTRFFVAGIGLYTGITMALHPASIVKTRLQVSSKDSIERNSFSVLKGLLKSDGFPGLYKGIGIVITGIVPGRIIFVTVLETTKASAKRILEPFRLSETTNVALENGVAGMASATVAQTVFVPMDVISQKVMVQGYSGHAQYSGGLDVARKILRSDGIRGLYRGFGLSLMTHSPSNAIWWATYGLSQRLIWRFVGHGTEHEQDAPSEHKLMLVHGAGGIIASATATCITYPADTIRTRLQVMGHEKRGGIKKVVKDLINEDGWKGFYRGLGAKIISTSAMATSMVMGYEYLKRICVKDQ